MPAAPINGNGRPQLTQAPNGTIFYAGVPDGNGGFTDGYLDLGTLAAALESTFSMVTDADSPFAADPNQRNYLIDTRNALVTFTLPATPAANQRFNLTPAAVSYSTNSLFIAANGNPIQGVVDDVEVSVDGLSVSLVWINETYGWAVIAGGQTVYMQRSTVYGADTMERRADNSTDVVTSITDQETLIVMTGDTAPGTVTLFDSSAVTEGTFQMSFVQEGAGAKTFQVDPASSDTLLALDDAVLTSGPGAFVTAFLIAPGTWAIAGGLV